MLGKYSPGFVISDILMKGRNKQTYAVGDSIIKGLSGRGISEENNVKRRWHPRCTLLDLVDQSKPTLPKKTERN